MDRYLEDLPDSVDVVILGTDITQSILAAACARNGLSVLHLDRDDYYGGKSCVLPLNTAEELISSTSSTNCNRVDFVNEQPIKVEDGEEALDSPRTSMEKIHCLLHDFPCSTQPSEVHSSEPFDENADVRNTQVSSSLSSQTSSWTKETLLAASRKFNIDMFPNLVFSAGKTVELLVSSDVARYVEFKNVGKLYVHNGDSFEHVPCSRADIFSDCRLSLIEKRLLMRLFTSALDFENKLAEENVSTAGSFLEYLRTICRLPDRLVYFVQHTIAMVSDQCTIKDGLFRIRSFLKSCSIYGPTPFLWPMYGCAEFPQAFCRLAAVYGAIYVLRTSPVAIIKDKTTNKCTSVMLDNGKKVSCQFVVTSCSYCPPGLLNRFMKLDTVSFGYSLILRAVLLSNKSIFPVDSGQAYPPVLLARIPKDSFIATMIELPDHSQACPQGTFLHHVTANIKTIKDAPVSPENQQAAVEEFNQLLQSFFCFDNSDGGAVEEAKPIVFWRYVFAQSVFTLKNPVKELSRTDYALMDNLFILPDSLSNDGSLDFDICIEMAELVFRKIKPDADEFIPKMPRPPVSEDVAVSEYLDDLESPADQPTATTDDSDGGYQFKQVEPEPESVGGSAPGNSGNNNDENPEN